MSYAAALDTPVLEALNTLRQGYERVQSLLLQQYFDEPAAQRSAVDTAIGSLVERLRHRRAQSAKSWATAKAL